MSILEQLLNLPKHNFQHSNWPAIDFSDKKEYFFTFLHCLFISFVIAKWPFVYLFNVTNYSLNATKKVISFS